eukprot:TRINITY_DN774_c0_g1_i2.p1 TRINITY_DN774_c0_g1~~TRINITY_DN774_c0_g1_i2.p1  ORF type:complete len:329 (+),score=48.67 TRINITY_DN774_c0_g1_i2:150-1136(+)
MTSQSETLLSPSVIHQPSRTVCLTQPEPATILIDDSDSEESIDEHEPERAQINTRGRKRQREDEPQTRRKRLRTSMASEVSNSSDEEVIDLTSERDIIDVETAPSASRAPSVTPMTARNASYPPSPSPLNSLMRSFGMGQYYPQLPSYLLNSYQHHPPAAAIDFLFGPASVSMRSYRDDYNYRPREAADNVEDRFGGGYWSRRRQQQQQLTRSSGSTGSSSQPGPVTVVDIDDDEPTARTSTSASGSTASTRSPDEPNATETKSTASVADLAKDLKCAICLGTIENITATVCGHIFCEGCILPAIEIQRKCPICRTPLTKKSIHPLFF